MEKAKMSNRKKVLALAAVLVLVGIIAGAVAIKKLVDKKANDASWAEYYMEQCAPYTLAYDELPGDIESWRAWQPDGFGIDKLTDDDNDRIGKNDLGTLSHAYERLVEIRLVEPENGQCRELFETLTPYFEKAFHWEEGTTPEECLKRLRELSEEEAMEEIEELTGPVWDFAGAGENGARHRRQSGAAAGGVCGFVRGLAVRPGLSHRFLREFAGRAVKVFEDF